MKIENETLSLAAEFAVASELCRRNIYAQLTLGRHKRTDLLIETDRRMLRIQVKAKQGSVWPNCTGVHGDDAILVLVDYSNKRDTERPDFYVLTARDWENLGRPEPSMGVRPGSSLGSWQFGARGVKEHMEHWDKITCMLGL